MYKKLMEILGVNRGVLALSVARMGDSIGNSILFIIIPLYVAKMPDVFFHFPVPILVGILISVFGIVTAIVQPIMGAITDRLGKQKPLIQLGLFLIAISTLAFIIAQNFIDLLLLRTLQGAAIAITIPASMTLMAVITNKKTRGGAMGVYTTFRMIGFAIGPLVGGYLQVHFGFNAAFYVGAGFLFLAMLLVQMWVKDAKIEVDPDKPKPKVKIIDLSLLNPGLVSAAISTFLMASAFSVVTTLENEFNSRLDITAFGFSIAFSMLMVSRLIFQVPLGHYSDKIGRKPLIIAGLLLMAPATILLGETATLTELIIIRLVQGIAAAAIAAPAFAVAADLSKSGGEGRQMSLITMGFGLGIAIGPLLAGFLSVVFFELPFLTIGILSFIGSWIVYKYLPETAEGKKVLFKERFN